MSKKMVTSISVPTLINAYLPVFLCAATIFYFSHQSSLHGFELDIADFIFKKIAHMGEYFLLYYFLHRALKMTVFNPIIPIWLIAFVLCVGYAFSDEWHQSFVTGRTASLRDVGFDTLGVSLAFLRIYRYI